MSERIETEQLHVQEPAPSLLRPFLISLAVSALLAVVTYWVFRQIPETSRIPMHWNAQGKVDGYGSRGTLFLMPGIVAALGLILFLVPRIDPRSGNLLRSTVAYEWVWLGLVGFFSLIQGLILASALGHNVAMDRWMLGALGGLFMIIGNFLGKVRSNFIFGLRTPWTLSSDLAWNKAHRLAGRLFVVGGALIAVVSWLMPRWNAAFLITILLVLVLVPTLYSYLVWRQDPNKRS